MAICLDLVLQQSSIDGFRAYQMRPSAPQEVPPRLRGACPVLDTGCKAPYADNGCSIVKDSNAAWAHLVGSLRADWQGLIHGVASLAKGLALHGETRLVANALPAR